MTENIFTLFMLILLQAVLGFDNLLYITLESKRAPKEKQAYVRNMGIGLAMILRIALLFALLSVIEYFQDPILNLNAKRIIKGHFNIHSLIILTGGIFIVYTATREIMHMLSLNKLEHKTKSIAPTGWIILTIVLMNLVFSFDSILSAMALTKVFWIMASAIIVGSLLMIWLSDKVASFLERNKKYEVLGLFILFVVGIMLLTEGGHVAHLELFGNVITPMSKTTFYFIIVILVIVDVVQSKYQKNLHTKQQERNIN
ncbi:MAG: hypothetical protein JXB49_24820 [Bacteroidales bacterium]|nr:hypothetical protein [Bacteroidales bacterium]